MQKLIQALALAAALLLPARGQPATDESEDCPADYSSMLQRRLESASLATAAREHGNASGTSAIAMSWFGQQDSGHLVGAQIVEGNGFIMTMDPFMKVYLMNSPVASSGKTTDYKYLKLAGNSFQVSVDMGSDGPGCGCNVALFLVSMPHPELLGGDHYCDANCIGGGCCAEFDLIEMNLHTLQVTSHACTDYQRPPFASGSENCDAGGHPEVKFGNGQHDFGPGEHFTIDSRKAFTFKMDFPYVGSRLTGHIVLTQGSRRAEKHMDDLSLIEQALSDGMALVGVAWHAEDLAWLDGGAAACSIPERCNMASTRFWNIVVDKVGPEETHQNDPPASVCPGHGLCDCNWANQGTCSYLDGTECNCRCCCDMVPDSHGRCQDLGLMTGLSAR